MKMRDVSRPQSGRAARRPTTSRGARSAPRRDHAQPLNRRGLRPARKHRAHSPAVPLETPRLKYLAAVASRVNTPGEPLPRLDKRQDRRKQVRESERQASLRSPRLQPASAREPRLPAQAHPFVGKPHWVSTMKIDGMDDTLDRTAQPFLHRPDRAIALLQ